MKNLFARGKKIPLENVIKNLKMGKYIMTVNDYANTGIDLFMENKFSDNLGVSVDKLFKSEILKKNNQNGWNLTQVPDWKNLKNKLEAKNIKSETTFFINKSIKLKEIKNGA